MQCNSLLVNCNLLWDISSLPSLITAGSIDWIFSLPLLITLLPVLTCFHVNIACWSPIHEAGPRICCCGSSVSNLLFSVIELLGGKRLTKYFLMITYLLLIKILFSFSMWLSSSGDYQQIKCLPRGKFSHSNAFIFVQNAVWLGYLSLKTTKSRLQICTVTGRNSLTSVLFRLNKQKTSKQTKLIK